MRKCDEGYSQGGELYEEMRNGVTDCRAVNSENKYAVFNGFKNKIFDVFIRAASVEQVGVCRSNLWVSHQTLVWGLLTFRKSLLLVMMQRLEITGQKKIQVDFEPFSLLCMHACMLSRFSCCQVPSVVSDSVWPHRRQPTSLPRPWDSPGKNMGVGCHFLPSALWEVKVKSPSHVRLLATPWTATYQVPPSLGFSRQEYWSGVPLPSP